MQVSMPIKGKRSGYPIEQYRYNRAASAPSAKKPNTTICKGEVEKIDFWEVF